MADTQLETIAEQLGRLAHSHDYFIATAESCTGGGLSEVITRIAGSSQWFDRGFVTYSNSAKVDMLAVQEQTLEVHGAVSEATAEEMVLGALKNSQADIAVSITGIAGPSGGTEDKPVGTVCFAWANRNNHVQTTTANFTGDRHFVREQSCMLAMQGLIELLDKPF